MGLSKIEQLIEDIYEFVESCKMQPLSTTKVIVPKDELYDLLDELRLRTPDEIKRYQKIIANRDAILSDAEEKASIMLADAQAKTNALVDEHEIMQQAYAHADEVVNSAAQDANRMIAQAQADAEQIRSGALAYANDMLGEVENILTNAYESSRNKYENLMASLKGNLDIVINNKKELMAPATAAAADEAGTYGNEQGNYDNDFDFDPNTFLEDLDD